MAATVSLDELAGEAAVAAVDQVLTDHGDLPWDTDAFADVQRVVRRDAPARRPARWPTPPTCSPPTARVRARTARVVAESARPAVADIEAHVRASSDPASSSPPAPADCPISCGTPGASSTASSLGCRPPPRRPADGRGRPAGAQVRRPGQEPRSGPPPPEVVDLGWQLEELRVSVFAQPIGARGSRQRDQGPPRPRRPPRLTRSECWTRPSAGGRPVRPSALGHRAVQSSRDRRRRPRARPGQRRRSGSQPWCRIGPVGDPAPQAAGDRVRARASSSWSSRPSPGG